MLSSLPGWGQPRLRKWRILSGATVQSQGAVVPEDPRRILPCLFFSGWSVDPTPWGSLLLSPFPSALVSQQHRAVLAASWVVSKVTKGR